MSVERLPEEERAVVATVREAAMQNALDAVRVHGGAGCSTGYDVERCFRDAPLMVVGEGTTEIQRQVIAEQLVRRGGLPA